MKRTRRIQGGFKTPRTPRLRQTPTKSPRQTPTKSPRETPKSPNKSPRKQTWKEWAYKWKYTLGLSAAALVAAGLYYQYGDSMSPEKMRTFVRNKTGIDLSTKEEKAAKEAAEKVRKEEVEKAAEEKLNKAKISQHDVPFYQRPQEEKDKILPEKIYIKLIGDVDLNSTLRDAIGVYRLKTPNSQNFYDVLHKTSFYQNDTNTVHIYYVEGQGWTMSVNSVYKKDIIAIAKTNSKISPTSSKVYFKNLHGKLILYAT